MGKTFVYNTGVPIVPKGELHLEFGMFFDGTLNNMYNTKLREEYRDKSDRIKPKEGYVYKSDGTKISNDDYERKVKQNEAIIKTRREEQELEYDALQGDKEEINSTDSEKVKYLKSSHREPLRPGEGRWGMDELGVDNSFSNDYTNIARMYKCCDENYHIYIEGIGTIGGKDDKGNEKVGRDVDDGFQYGSGFTGVRGKVRRGCEMLAESIKKAKKLQKTGIKLSQIIIDVSGFSRGAAAARNFVYEVNNHSKRPEDREVKCVTKRRIVGYKDSRSYANDAPVPIYESYTVCKDKDKIELNQKYLDDGKMPRFGYLGYYLLSKGVFLRAKELDELTLSIRFIGVYDTVSSYEEFGDMNLAKRLAVGVEHAIRGAEYHFGNDVEQLQLNKLGGYTKAIHFTAKDEHRENFALTRFPGSKEFNFPGVHCDIGGAYETGTEIVDEVETANINNFLSNYNLVKRRKHLITEHWWKEEQLTITFEEHSKYSPLTKYNKMTGTRFLKKEYSYIPLHFMEELGSVMKHKIIRDTFKEYPLNNPTLDKVKDHLKKYVDGKAGEWQFITDKEIARKKLDILEREQIEKDLRESVKMEADALKVKKQPEIPILIETPKFPINSKIPEENEKIKTSDIEEIMLHQTEQDLLRILRNKYLHWSANRDWLGMDPAKKYKRVEH